MYISVARQDEKNTEVEAERLWWSDACERQVKDCPLPSISLGGALYKIIRVGFPLRGSCTGFLKLGCQKNPCRQAGLVALLIPAPMQARKP